MSTTISLSTIRKIFQQGVAGLHGMVDVLSIPNFDLEYSFLFDNFKGTTPDKEGLEIVFYPSPRGDVPEVVLGVGTEFTSPGELSDKVIQGLIFGELLRRHSVSIGRISAGTLSVKEWVKREFLAGFGIEVHEHEGWINFTKDDPDKGHQIGSIRIQNNPVMEVLKIVAAQISKLDGEFGIAFPGNNRNPIYRAIMSGRDRLGGDGAGKYRGVTYMVGNNSKGELSGQVGEIKFQMTEHHDNFVLTTTKGTHQHISSISKRHLALDGEIQLAVERIFDRVN